MKRIPFRTPADAVTHYSDIRTHLEDGGLIAYPTETVYGFGCLLLPDALSDLQELKSREASRPFLLLTSEPGKLEGLTWTEPGLHLARRFWPGPLTIALAADVAYYKTPVLSPTGTVAIRHTSQPALLAFLQTLQEPITSTSANPPGGTAATTVDGVEDALKALGRDDVLILDGGPLPVTETSTIVDCSGARVRLVREGAIPRHALQAALSTGGFRIDVG